MPTNTKRIPIARLQRRVFSKETLDLFAQMQGLTCTCKPRW